MREIKHFCDICGVEVLENEMGQVRVEYKRKYNAYRYAEGVYKYIDICENCASTIVNFDDMERGEIKETKTVWDWLNNFASKIGWKI